LALIAKLILASDALVINKLVSVLAGDALAGGGVGETSGDVADVAGAGSSQGVGGVAGVTFSC
jgi:hypothetical protein